MTWRPSKHPPTSLKIRVATKYLRRFLVGLVKESLIKGEGKFKNLMLRGHCLGQLKPNVLCAYVLSLLISTINTDQLTESFLEGEG